MGADCADGSVEAAKRLLALVGDGAPGLATGTEPVVADLALIAPLLEAHASGRPTRPGPARDDADGDAVGPLRALGCQAIRMVRAATPSPEDAARHASRPFSDDWLDGCRNGAMGSAGRLLDQVVHLARERHGVEIFLSISQEVERKA